MTERNFRFLGNLPERWRRMAVIAGALAVLGVAISCTTVTRTVIVPPDIPGASYVGSKECEQCHDDLCRDFKTASHARLVAKGTNAINMGCESCHGPGSLHVESGGERKTANNRLNLERATPAPMPVSILNPRRSAEVCFSCHLDKRGTFSLPSHHAVPEGRMSCNDCHDPHKGTVARGGLEALAENARCIKCHEAQHGPYVFEHPALREGCTACHDPHGSVNQKMLLARNANLCLKCHFQQPAPGGAVLIGGVNHKTSLQQGTCWTAGCHEAVHGSRVNASLRF